MEGRFAKGGNVIFVRIDK